MSPYRLNQSLTNTDVAVCQPTIRLSMKTLMELLGKQLKELNGLQLDRKNNNIKKPDPHLRAPRD
jgi:hypothetical protein